MKKAITILLTLTLIVGVFANVYAVNGISGDNEVIYGTLKTIIVFNEGNVEKGKKWYKSSIDDAKKNLRDLDNKVKDKKDKEKIEKALKELSKIDVKEKFKDKSDGKSVIEIPMPFIRLQVDEYSTKTNEFGEFILENITLGKHTAELFYGEEYIGEVELHIKNKKEAVNINLEVAGENIFRTAELMSKNMESGYSKEMNSGIVQSLDTYYPEYPIGTIVGYGKGAMKIVASNNIVSCNKADNSIADTSDFPFNGSDCSDAIAQGTLYASNPTLYFYFYRSYNCFIESAQSVMGENKQNVYCNGLNKDGHYNCSWFFGISHSESLHTH